MARTVSDEQIYLDIVINGNPAQKELFETERAIKKLNKEQSELRKEKKELDKAGLKETARYKEITIALKENSDALKKNKERVKELQNEIGLVGLSLSQLRAKAHCYRDWETSVNIVTGKQVLIS